MAGNAALVFGALVAGAVVIDYGVKNAKTAFASTSSTTLSTGTGSGIPQKIGDFPQSVNPLPDARTTQQDQGIDATGTQFPSPWAGKIVKATANDPGWKNGGYIAVQSRENPSFIYYIAEGITPVVHLGEDVNAGDILGMPVPNPYNGSVGNVEAGLANPSNPGQPLAQVVRDPAGMVRRLAGWLTGLGVSVTSAGHPGYA